MHESRRNFLRALLGVSALALVYPARAPFSFREAGSCDLLAVNLANFFRDKESAQIIGMEYLRCMPRERNVGSLIDRIFSCGTLCQTEFAEAGMKKGRELLLQQIREDFEQERTVNIEGWILSQTEARLCALTALV